jgi:NAD(P)-dependent dehydrogenase (short-subunit alcohol dehydrogenase family)
MSSARALSAEISADGGEADVFRADVSDAAQVAAMFTAIDERFGRAALRGLVNNAGVVDRAARVDEMSPERLQRMFAINTLGSFHCAREALRRISTRHGGSGGSIVNVSSVAARLGAPAQYVDYAAAKAAIDTFTSLAKAYVSTPCGRESSTPKFTPAAASPNGPGRALR